MRNKIMVNSKAALGLTTLAALGLAAAHPQAARAQQTLYATNSGHGNSYLNSIEKFTPSGAASTFASKGLNVPVGLAFDSAGNLYVANTGNGTSYIDKFTPSGASSVFASDPGDNSVLSETQGLAFDKAGNLYAANYSGSTIREFTPGGVVSTFADQNNGVFQPLNLAFDSAGNLYYDNNYSASITKITPGGVASTFASDPGNGSELAGPTGLAFDSAGNLYVANYYSNSIEEFTPGGIASTFASTGLNAPQGLAFDIAGNLYAANSGNSTIEKFTPGGVGSVFASDPGDGSVMYGVSGLAFAPAAAPEPSQFAALGLGVLGLAGLAVRARRRSA